LKAARRQPLRKIFRPSVLQPGGHEIERLAATAEIGCSDTLLDGAAALALAIIKAELGTDGIGYRLQLKAFAAAKAACGTILDV
jgi:hypothetical protein